MRDITFIYNHVETPIEVQAFFKLDDGDYIIDEITASHDNSHGDIFGELKEVFVRVWAKTEMVSVADKIKEQAYEEIK
jgi:hypothetical protein